MAAALDIARNVRFDERSLATALGWFSIGLGLAEIVAPRRVARVIGLPEDDTRTMNTLRAFGVREVTNGVGILSQSRPAGWVWARVGGDVLDLAALGAALRSDRARPERVLAAMAAVAGITALDMACGKQLSERDEGGGDAAAGHEREHGVHIRRAVTVGRPAEDLYRFWRDVENLPRFMRSVQSVRAIDAHVSHWVMKLPLYRTVEWHSEITEDVPNERLAWRSRPGADVENSGSVRFEPAPGGRGTVVRLELRYEPPGGALAGVLAKLLGKAPAVQVQQDLRAFKQIMEVGEVTESDATVSLGGPARPQPLIAARTGGAS